MNNLASIQISKDGSKISAVKVIMPISTELVYDGQFQVLAPALGIQTFVSDENNAATAIKEAIACLVFGSEKFGRGFEAELLAFGWNSAGQNHAQDSFFSLTTDKEYFDSALATGDVAALEMEMA